MAGSGIMGNSVSALLASQRALATISHNISNATTEGYSRQQVEMVTRPPQFRQGSFLGKGVSAGNVTRNYDNFLTGQLRASSSSVAHVQTFETLALQVDDLLADEKAGLSPMLQNFFNSVQDVADDPSSVNSRQVMISEAQSLESRFNSLEFRMADLERDVSHRIAEEVVEINGLASAIADLNQDILLARGRGSGRAEPNDLLDERDQLLVDLAEHVNITVIAQDDGTINVAIGTGQLLVNTSNVNPVAIVTDTYDASRKEIGFDTGAGPVVISGLLSGGSVAGLVEFRSQFLDAAQNSMGKVAIGLTDRKSVV